MRWGVASNEYFLYSGMSPRVRRCLDDDSSTEETELPTVDTSRREELIFRWMVDALRARDQAALETLLADDVELCSYATGLETIVGRANALAAVQANKHSLYDPIVTRFNHLGDGWMIVSARIRHSLQGGGIADSAKTLLVRVLDEQVRLSLVYNTAAEVHAEYVRRTGGESIDPPAKEPTVRSDPPARLATT